MPNPRHLTVAQTAELLQVCRDRRMIKSSQTVIIVLGTTENGGVLDVAGRS